MKELEKLEEILTNKLQEIRAKGDKGTQTAYDRQIYSETQDYLRKIYCVKCLLKEYSVKEV